MLLWRRSFLPLEVNMDEGFCLPAGGSETLAELWWAADMSRDDRRAERSWSSRLGGLDMELAVLLRERRVNTELLRTLL